MSDSTNEAAGLGAADPVTGVVAGGDDLAQDTRLPDAAAEDDLEATHAEADDVVTNDAVAGETVDPGTGDGNDGPTGGAPAEITPDEPRLDLLPDGFDLNDQDESAY
jgi:hypothetical protein